MKKYLVLFLAVAMSGSLLVGCSSSKDKEEDKKDDSTSQVEGKEETKAPEEDKTETPTTPTTLSKDWKDNQIQIKGKVITFPVKLTELNNLGFDFDNLGEFIVNPNQGVYGKGLVDADKNKFSGVYVNMGDKAVDVRQTTMTEITILKDYRMETNKNFDVVLPGGIKFGDSLDQIKAIYGKPSSESESGKSNIVKYKENGDSLKHWIEMSIYDGKLISYNLKSQ